MSRKAARDQAFKLLYEFCSDESVNEFSLELALSEFDGDDGIYIEKVYRGVIEHYELLKDIVRRFSNGFAYERIFKIDCALLLLASFEILFLDDVPERVSVNEAVELAKTYSTEKSASFINGILASVIAQKETLKSERQDN